MTPNPFNIPRFLIDTIAEGECVVFVGAGLSVQAGLPTWVGLIRDMLTWALNHNPGLSTASAIRTRINNGRFMEAAEALIGAMTPNEQRDFMIHTFAQAAPADAHRILAEIPFQAVITTNFDLLLEEVYPRRTPTLDYTQRGNIQRVLAEDAFHIFKAHGDYNGEAHNPPILTRSQYRNLLLNKHPAYSEYLRRVLSEKHVLFLGYSLQDPDLNFVLDTVQDIFDGHLPTHYALFPQSEIDELTGADNLSRNIRILSYPDHSQLVPWLRSLADEVAKSTP
ncbi:MAG: SIR2 family protein [bacterium]|nr:SIR2 family protein [bacterium]